MNEEFDQEEDYEDEKGDYTNNPFEEDEGNKSLKETWRELLENMNAVKVQLDNTELLRRSKCRFLGGYYDKKKGFIKYKDHKKRRKMNELGWSVCEHFIDKNTCPNEVLSNKNANEIENTLENEAYAFAKNMFANYNKYEINLEDIEFIVVMCVGIAYSGQKRSLGGNTAKAINKVFKTIESIVRSDQETPKKRWGWGG